MNISLKRIVEQQGAEGQYYDLGTDFSNFRRTLDGSTDQIKQKFEQAIGSKLNGKRIRARASRGYKQYVKDYEFDVVKITLDDYYDNYVVIAHDNTTPKAKEYFLKAGFKIQIIGIANGQQPSGVEPQGSTNEPTPVKNPDAAQSEPLKPVVTQQQSIEKPVQENEKAKQYDAYSIENIIKDIKTWLPQILEKPDTVLRDFTKGLGWMTKQDSGQSIAIFDLKLPKEMIKININTNTINDILKKINVDPKIKFSLMKITPDESNDEFTVRLKKTTTQ